MKVINIHKRTIHQPKSEVTKFFKTLSTEDDKIWPTETWPRMTFENGIREGAKGGHGPIRYTVEVYQPDAVIQFRFTRPHGFIGIHKFEIKKVTDQQTEVIHTLAMTTSGKGTFFWMFVFRPLHDALIEDALDKLENNFSYTHKKTEWNWWVKMVRKQLKKQRKRN